MRTAVALLAALVVTSSCLGDCSGVGMVGDMRAGDMQHGDMRGSMTMPSDGAVVGVDWPTGAAYGDLVFLFEAEKEACTDGAGTATPTNFGVGTIDAPTQGTGANQPTCRSPCTVGPSGIPCWELDGTNDSWRASAADSALKFLHDGTGSACYAVFEASATAAASPIFDNGAWGTTDIGTMLYWTGAASQRASAYVMRGVSSQALVNGPPTGGTLGHTRTVAMGFAHGSSRSPNYRAIWRGESSAETGDSGAYAFTPPSTSNPSYPLTIGARGQTGITYWKGYLFALACYNAAHTATQMGDVLDAIEAHMGTMPQ